MKRLIASFALTVVLTAGIASPISAQVNPSPITPVAQDGWCVPGSCDSNFTRTAPIKPVLQDGWCLPGSCNLNFAR